MSKKKPTMSHSAEQRKAWHKERAARQKAINRLRGLNHRNFAQRAAVLGFSVRPNPHRSSGGEGKAIFDGGRLA